MNAFYFELINLSHTFLTTILKGKQTNRFFYLIFFNKHAIFHYNKLKLQQNDINTKRYTRLKFK